MDETRKLLDSLMGNTRNMDMEEAKKNKGINFMKDSICKGHLLGFCPLSELSDSKMAGKRHIKPCTKSHSEAAKEEFEAHEERAKYQAEYEKKLLPVMEGLAREADSWVTREASNVKEVAGKTESIVKNTMAPSQKEQYDALKEDLGKMMASAEDEADKGNVEGSKFKVMLAEEIKVKVKELEEAHLVTYEVTHRGEDVCPICGTRYEALTKTNHARHMAHFEGKVHLAYKKIREWIAKLKPEKSDSPKRSDDKGGSPKRDRRRSRSRRGDKEKDQKKDRSRERDSRREPERRRSRSRRGDRDGDRDRRRSRSRGDRRR